MICPKCGYPMSSTQADGVIHYFCHHCGNSWTAPARFLVRLFRGRR